MRFAEVDLFGVYVAPMSVMMAAAWLVLRGAAEQRDHFGCADDTSGNRSCCVRFLHYRAPSIVRGVAR